MADTEDVGISGRFTREQSRSLVETDAGRLAKRDGRSTCPGTPPGCTSPRNTRNGGGV